MTIIKSSNSYKTLEEIKTDITCSFNKIISQNTPIYFITITDIPAKSARDLKFKLTNNLFNNINKRTRIKSNYLFVIEYPKKVSCGNLIPDRLDTHSHIILSTTLPQQVIQYYIENSFKNPNIDIQNITERSDKHQLVNYLLKQNLLTNDNYKYKIQQ